MSNVVRNRNLAIFGDLGFIQLGVFDLDQITFHSFSSLSREIFEQELRNFPFGS